jgi:flagellar export protein FliJ
MSRIDAVLRIRRVQETMAKAVLAQANHELSASTAAEDSWRQNMQQWGAKRETLNSGDFQSWRATLGSANKDMRNLEQQTVESTVAKSVALDLLIDATRRVDVLERLDERFREAALIEETRAEQSTIDEVAITVFSRTAEAALSADQAVRKFK